MKNPRLILSIESAIQSGSISLLRGTEEIGAWVGEKAVSRSEELLTEISKIFSANSLSLADIDLIAVSNRFGSHTGLRIGLATALGLHRASGAGIVGISLLEALADQFPSKEGVISAVSGNARDYFAQQFADSQIDEAAKYTEEGFRELVSAAKPGSVAVNDLIFESCRTIESPETRLFNAGRNLAKCIGLFAAARDISPDTASLNIGSDEF